MRLLVLVAALCLCAASPPPWFAGAGLLVLPGWMAFYALIDPERCKCPLRAAYVIGLVHMLVFSFSVRHLMFGAWVGIGVVGGLYYVLTSYQTRWLSRFVPGAVAFGVALAGACWLRAHFSEIHYPHVQPAHCLYRWPALLGSLAWGGEVLGNVLLGVLAGAIVDLYRAWRLARPAFGRSRVVLGITVAVFLLSLIPYGERTGTPETVRLVLVEPRVSPAQMMSREWGRILLARVITPTVRVAGPAAADPPDLVVWPESVYVHRVDGTADAPRVQWIRGLPFTLAPGTRLLTGTSLPEQNGRPRALALLTDAAGRYVGHHEKRRAVPGGEHTPFFDWLPHSWSEWLRAKFESAMGQPLPEITPGQRRPPMETARGVRFGALICFDNAFPEISEELVRDGATFLVVISNEAWFRGGAELHQMEAMTVCRALECHVPLVRCTVDGATLVVSADGRVTHRLPIPWPDHASGEILTVDLPVVVGAEPALPPLRPATCWLVWLSLLMLALRMLAKSGRLFRVGFLRSPADP